MLVKLKQFGGINTIHGKSQVNLNSSFATVFYSLSFNLKSTDLHAVCEHDADGHELGEDPEELWVGQHAVLQAVVQKAGVMTEHVIDI